MVSITSLFIPANIELYFTRHARSMENDGKFLVVDSPLSSEGRLQSMTLHGHFDYVISSPLRRCVETLHYSNLSYDNLAIDANFRERIFTDSSRMLLEKGTLWELDSAFHKRVEDFQDELTATLNRISSEAQGTTRKVLLIGHSYFFNYWAGRSVFSSVDNASIIRITD